MNDRPADNEEGAFYGREMLKEFFTALCDALFPKASLTGIEGEWVTPSEHALLRQSCPIVLPTFALRSLGIRHLDALYAGSSYAGHPLLKRALWTFKFRRIRGYADVLSEILLRGVEDHVSETSVLVPVPLHWTRRFLRGFNQAELLAYSVARHHGMEVSSILRRVRPTGYQSHRSHDDRRSAVQGAFAVRGVAPRHVVLIDDVATTCATLDACAKALKEAGAQYIEGWVVAKG